jgi:methionine synthase I (cobalamin-dependent)
MAQNTGLLEAVRDRILVCEGAMGSMLAAQGLSFHNTTEMNLRHPEAVADVHRAYKDAGAEVFQTNTLAANLHMLERAGLAGEAAEAQVAAIRLLRDVVGGDGFIGADIGPTGAMIEPFGDLAVCDAVSVFRQQLEVMLAEGVDFVLFETFEVLEELEAGIEAFRELGATVPLAATMSFSSTGGRTMMGTDGANAARRLEEAGVDIIGANCGDPASLSVAIQAMRTVTPRPLMAQANAGVPRLVSGETVFDGTPVDSGQLASDLIRDGVRILGGCCGTTPEHIRQIARAAHAAA